jgi:uncharacterized protein
MPKADLNRDLSDKDYDWLDTMLTRVVEGKIPNVETLDGFMTALVVCPDLIKPNEYMSVILSGKTEDGDLVFESAREAEHFYGLLMRHWNTINRELRSGDVHMPYLAEDAEGNAYGNDWAKGFLIGTHLRHAPFARIANDEERGGPFVPIWSLAYEHAEDPKLRPFKEAITQQTREHLIAGMIAGVKNLYRVLQEDWKRRPGNPFALSSKVKVGRNDPCPCGSGKKFKHCCSQITVH